MYIHLTTLKVSKFSLAIYIYLFLSFENAYSIYIILLHLNSSSIPAPILFQILYLF